MKYFLRISILLMFITACAVTYDMPVMYQKNYVPGTHALLRCDGYYFHENNAYKPLYLYLDGSVWFAEHYVKPSVIDIEAAKKNPNVQYSWGNYKIDADTIYIERFHRADNTNNYRRITLKGIIMQNEIKWIQREENRQNPVVVDYITRFQASSVKPDSSGNWTRTRAQYNK